MNKNDKDSILEMSKKQYFLNHLSKIMTFEEGDSSENPWVEGAPQKEKIEVVEYNPEWPSLFIKQKSRIQNALGSVVISINHVGSTAVPGLPAKPVIDIDLIVAHPENEQLYVPLLEELGYQLTIREPSWYQHRMLRLEQPRVNLHIFALDCPEHIRHILFRDWLVSHPEDKELYQNVKKEALISVDNVQSYNQNKQVVIRDIYNRILEFISK
ncbi:GrpB family protein [Providencia manganoxydans]|uniref:GrpB family protein n=2 Tax=Providencia manganoxydans TaxID=2923283 RepID=UPI0034DD8ADE